MRELPILFNTEMVKEIIAGRKTVTRRVVKQKYDNTVLQMKTDKYGTRLIEIEQDVEGVTFGKREDGTSWRKLRGYIEPKPPYQKYDILYVRETWKQAVTGTAGPGLIDTYLYKADGEEVPEGYDAEERWHPSIHMPKSVARIWLKVKDVRAERLQDITEDDVFAEGAETIINRCQHMVYSCVPPEPCYNANPCPNCIIDYSSPELFGRMVWNPTISKKDADRYDWYANPWVWRIEFEKIERYDKKWL